MESLSDLAPEDVPETSRFLLEINFTKLSKSLIETQKYWTLEVKAALVAQDLEFARGVRAKQIRNRIYARIQKEGRPGGNRATNQEGRHALNIGAGRHLSSSGPHPDFT
jgi:hypothetical protein